MKQSTVISKIIRPFTKMIRSFLCIRNTAMLICCLAFTFFLVSGFTKKVLPKEYSPHYPTDIKRTANNQFLISNKGTKTVDLMGSDFDKLIKSWEFDEAPTGIAVAGDYAYITTFETIGKVYFLNLATGAIEKSIVTGSGANSPLLSPDNKYLYILNQFQNTITKINITDGRVVGETKVLREPACGIISKSGKYLFVANHLPEQRADVDTVAACLSVIDLNTFKLLKNIQLANGSNALRGIAESPDGRYVFVSHNLGRFQVPTNQLQQGWMNTSAISIINEETLNFDGAVLLDEPEKGAAGIWGIQCDDDKIIISHSGTHDISIIEYKPFIEKFENTVNKDELSYDLRFLYGLRERIKLTGNGPRQFVLHDKQAYIPTYFSDTLNVVNIDSPSDIEIYALAPNRKETPTQLGEMYFNDATYCFQNWQSCNGCHPGDARTDGMNWDLMNDGIGNPKNCKSLLYSHVTPPSMISGIRAMAEIAVRKGFELIQFSEISEEKAICVDEYLKSLRPVPSPYLVDGKLSKKAEEGKLVFEQLKCDRCHSGEYYTDMKMHRIGSDIEFEKGWDTPTLIEVWRTAPYLFDGRAETMVDVFKIHKHGIGTNQKVSDKDIEALSEYVNSL